MKKKKYLILSFLIPFLTMMIFFTSLGIFTNKIAATSDLYVQGISLFEYYRNVLTSDATFPYTFTKGLGGSMYGTFFYYLSSPLLLLSILFKDINTFIPIFISIKIGLCGLTMYIYLSKKELSSNKLLLLFSTSYALMGYNLNYYVNTMWLDGIILAPLIILGIEKIVNEKKDLLYIITLFVAIVANYYIGYILVLFSIIYYLYLIYLKTEDKHWIKYNKRNIIHFIIITGLIGLLCSFILIPSGIEVLDYLRVKRGKYKIINPNFFEFFASNYIGFGSTYNPLNDFSFLIYCGSIIYLLIACFFMDKTISNKEKKALFFLYLILFVPVIINPLNNIWHMFTTPMSFNRRYSFLVVLISIPIALKELKNLNGAIKKLKAIYIVYTFISIALIYLTIVVPDYFSNNSIIAIIITLIIVLLNIIGLLKKRKKMLYIILIIELITNMTIIRIQSISPDKKEYQESINILNELTSLCEDQNIRCETTNHLTMNDSLLLNYNGISTFLSTTNQNVIKFTNISSGYNAESNYTRYSINDPILDMLLGNKYIILHYNTKDYKKIKELKINGNKVYLFENPNALSFGYTVSKEIKNFKSDYKGYKYLEKILNTMDNNKQDYIVELEIEKKSNTKYVIKNPSKYQIIYLNTKNAPKKPKNLYGNDEYGIITSGKKEITLEFKKKPKKLKVYALNFEKLKEFKESRDELVININKGNYIKGKIEVTKDSTLFTTIPYEKGWSVFVDGKKVNHYEVIDSFIGIDIDKGIHTIEFKYNIPGLIIGIITSLCSLITIIIYEIRIYQKKITYKTIS